MLCILELFSGIGGMHYAFQYSELKGHVCAAIDINTVANNVYGHNHTDTPIMNNNIQKLNVKTLEKLGINTILMSPPCQPHTRVGNKRDVEDNRSDALNHICQLLPQCANVQYILMENVKGFEESLAREKYIDALDKCGYYYREFILTPTQMGVPNTRHRYYCVARKKKDFAFPAGKIWTDLPTGIDNNYEVLSLKNILEKDELCTDYLLDEKVLKRRVWLLDIVTRDAENTMCFTKAYTHYVEGTGSVYCPLSLEEMQDIFANLKILESSDEDRIWILLQKLKLRYFTPREVSRLMCFPETFNFPNGVTNRQKYRLLGNSINVRVVGELIKIMCSE
ncbi:tRNA (cytosine(38)-C(5))-methyltransferase [Haematobia irritans]|uniref:tRNA (cytosine(38)-C(5))-methyltransferase n=1 Tax=Haematobia irritans TaxID=7368 RepID=UPI003F4F7F58